MHEHWMIFERKQTSVKEDNCFYVLGLFFSYFSVLGFLFSLFSPPNLLKEYTLTKYAS